MKASAPFMGPWIELDPKVEYRLGPMNINGTITYSNQTHDSYVRLCAFIILIHFILQLVSNIWRTVSRTVLSEDVPCGHASYMGTSSNHAITG